MYLDTSALAKWYLPERGSEAFVEWLMAQPEPWVSTLASLEMRCLLARRRRNDEIDADSEERAFAAFEEDMANGHLFLHTVDDEAVRGGIALMARLRDHPLRSLDALHLALARQIAAPGLATADTTLASAAEALGMEVIRFGL